MHGRPPGGVEAGTFLLDAMEHQRRFGVPGALDVEQRGNALRVSISQRASADNGQVPAFGRQGLGLVPVAGPTQALHEPFAGVLRSRRFPDMRRLTGPGYDSSRGMACEYTHMRRRLPVAVEPVGPLARPGCAHDVGIELALELPEEARETREQPVPVFAGDMVGRAERVQVAEDVLDQLLVSHLEPAFAPADGVGGFSAVQMLCAPALAFVEVPSHVDAHGVRERLRRPGHHVEAAGADRELPVFVVLFLALGASAHVLVGFAGVVIGLAPGQRRGFLCRARRMFETEAGAFARLGGEETVQMAVLGSEGLCRLADDPVRFQGERALPGQPPDGKHDGEGVLLGVFDVSVVIETVFLAHVGERLVRKHRVEPVGRLLHRRDAYGGLAAFRRCAGAGGHVFPELVDLCLKTVQALHELVRRQGVEAPVGEAVRPAGFVQLRKRFAREVGDVEIAKHALDARHGPLLAQIAPLFELFGIGAPGRGYGCGCGPHGGRSLL